MNDTPETEIMSPNDLPQSPFLTDLSTNLDEPMPEVKVPKKRKPRAKKVKVEAKTEEVVAPITEPVKEEKAAEEPKASVETKAKKPIKAKKTTKAKKTASPKTTKKKSPKTEEKVDAKAPAKKATAKKTTAKKKAAATKKKTATSPSKVPVTKKMEVAKISKPLIQPQPVATLAEPVVKPTLGKEEKKETPSKVFKEKMEAIAAFSSAIVATAIPSRTSTNVPVKGNFWDRFTKPFQAMDQTCEEDHASIKNAVSAFLIKDIIQALVLSSLIANWMNYESFSFVRMTFTETSWLFVRILLLFFACEFAQAGIVYAIGKLMKKDCSYAKIVSAQSKPALDIGIAFIGFWLLSRISLPIGLVGLVAATCFAVMTYGYAYGKACKLESMQEALCNCASFAVKAILFGLWVNLLAGDVLRMIMSILS